MKQPVTRITIDFVGNEDSIERFIDFCKNGRKHAYNWITDGSLRDTFGGDFNNLVRVAVDGEEIVERKEPATAEF